MTKTLKVRKGPSDSATKFKIGTKKKGNDGNIWKIGVNKNGVKRWIKLSKKTKKRYKIPRTTNTLYDVYKKFDARDIIIVLYDTGKIKSFKVPIKKKERNDKYKMLENDKNIKSIFTAMLNERQYDTFYKSISEPNKDGVWVDWKVFKSWFNQLPTEKKWMV